MLNQTLKQAYKEEFDPSDPWGSNIQWMFDLAEYDCFHGSGWIVSMFDYSPGMLTECENQERKGLFDSVDYGELLHFAELLSRFDNMCRTKGLDY